MRPPRDPEMSALPDAALRQSPAVPFAPVHFPTNIIKAKKAAAASTMKLDDSVGPNPRIVRARRGTAFGEGVTVIACDKREAFAQGSASDEAIHSFVP
jgi:hypothetical protein